MAVTVPRSDVPLLVVGVGGTGKDIALSIKRKFIERFKDLDSTTLLPPRTAFLVIDADSTGVGGADPNGITGAEYCDITVNAILPMFRSRSFTESEKKWINPEITPDSIIMGAGGIRQVGRFQLFRSKNLVTEKLKRALDTIMSAKANTPPDKFSANILICGSLSGGTGSGTALDVAYIVRQLVSNHYPAYSDNLKVYGMFLMPESVIIKAGDNLSERQRKDLRANAFAAMEEIDYWMRQEETQDDIDVDYSGLTVHWNTAPFNYLGYLGHTWENGATIDNAYAVAVDKISDCFLFLAMEYPKTTGDGTVPHTIYASLSNAGHAMMDHNHDAPYPVSALAMSIGTGDWKYLAEDVKNFEAQETLDRVLDEHFFDASTGEEVTEADAALRQDQVVKGSLLGIAQTGDDFFANLKDLGDLGIATEEDFKAQNAYPLTNNLFTVRGFSAARQCYSERVLQFYAGAQDSINKYYQDRFDKMWDKFRIASKEAITNIQCGPIGYREFLDKVYLAAIGESKVSAETFSAEGGAGRAAVRLHTKTANDQYKRLIDVLHPGVNIPDQLAHGEWRNHGRLPVPYNATLRSLADAELEWRCMAGKAIALKAYEKKVKTYRDNLALVIEQLEKSQQEIAKRGLTTTDDTGLLSVDKLRKYLADDATSAQNIGQVRDRMLLEMADLIDTLPDPDDATRYEQRAQLVATFQTKIHGFVNTATGEDAEVNMDMMLAAAAKAAEVPGEAPVTPQQYMASNVARTLVASAKPMLRLNAAAKNLPHEYHEFHHIEVPQNATDMIAGLNQYITGSDDKKSNYSTSPFEDRVFMLNMKVCIPLYLMSDVMPLMQEYEAMLQDTRSAVSQGIHLIGKNQTNDLSVGAENTIDMSWRRLPCPIPPVEMGLVMSPRQTSNKKYLEAKFAQAVENGIITFQGIGGAEPYHPGNPNGDYISDVFAIHDFNLNGDHGVASTRNLQQIHDAIDAVANNDKLSEEDRLAQLRSMRSGEPVRCINYGRYMSNYANALDVAKIKPEPTDERATMDVCARNYESVRMELCAYILGTYPRYLDLVEKEFRIFEYLREAERKLEAIIEEKRIFFERAEKYFMLFVTDTISLDMSTFVLNYLGTQADLFKNDRLVVENDLLKQYPEYAFILQLGTKWDEFLPGVQQQISEEQKRYPADARTLLKAGERANIEPKIKAKVKDWMTAHEKLKINLTMNPAVKNQIVKFYEGYLQKATAIIEDFAMVD